MAGRPYSVQRFLKDSSDLTRSNLGTLILLCIRNDFCLNLFWIILKVSGDGYTGYRRDSKLFKAFEFASSISYVITSDFFASFLIANSLLKSARMSSSERHDAG